MLIAIIIICVVLAALLGVLIWAHHMTFGRPPRKDTDVTTPLVIESKSY